MSLWEYAQLRANDPLQPNLSSRITQQDLINKGLNIAGLAPVGMVSRAKTQYEIAHDIASKNAEKMLGLPKGNTAVQRANALGKQVDVYHGTKQDIRDGFKPVYEDQLTFTTPHPDFASGWIGKGARQTRTGDKAAQEIAQADKEYRAIREQIMQPDSLNKMEGSAFNLEYDKRAALARDALAKAGVPRGGDTLHGNILPLKARVEKTFNPAEDYRVMDDYIKSAFPDGVNDQGLLNMFKNGDYIVYENPKVVDYLKKRGYDSMVLRESSNYPSDSTLAVFDPSKLRSKFAAFDPARVNESDLLAGLAPYLGVGGLLGLGMYGNQDRMTD
jgi:hypothetical protein